MWFRRSFILSLILLIFYSSSPLYSQGVYITEEQYQNLILNLRSVEHYSISLENLNQERMILNVERANLTNEIETLQLERQKLLDERETLSLEWKTLEEEKQLLILQRQNLLKELDLRLKTLLEYSKRLEAEILSLTIKNKVLTYTNIGSIVIVVGTILYFSIKDIYK